MLMSGFSVLSIVVMFEMKERTGAISFLIQDIEL
jgi:hypothetical protein